MSHRIDRESLPENRDGITKSLQERLDRAGTIKKSCMDCSHFPVCDILKNTATFLGNNYSEKFPKPFNYEDLAFICKMYQPKIGEATRSLATV